MHSIGIFAYERTPGPPTFALFMGGDDTVGNYRSSTDKYTFSDMTMAAGSALDRARSHGAAAGNGDYGVFAAGLTAGSLPTATTSKYTYLSGATAASTAINAVEGWCGTGSSTKGYFGLGHYGGVRVDDVHIYTYATAAVGAGTVLGTDRRYAGACGTETVGYFGGGQAAADAPNNTVDKYTYSTDAVTAGTVLGLAREGIAAMSNSSRGIFAGGYAGSRSDYTDKYTFSGDVVAAATVLTATVYQKSGAARLNQGLFAGGIDASFPSAVTNRYTFATDAVAAGTSLGTARTLCGATCSLPGHLS